MDITPADLFLTYLLEGVVYICMGTVLAIILYGILKLFTGR